MPRAILPTRDAFITTGLLSIVDFITQIGKGTARLIVYISVWQESHYDPRAHIKPAVRSFPHCSLVDQVPIIQAGGSVGELYVSSFLGECEEDTLIIP